MSSEWPTVKLGDYCKKIGSGATPRGGANVYTSEGAICLIRSQNIYNEGFRPSGLVYIDVESADKLKNVTVEENDVLLNITGDSVARVCLAKKTFLPARVNQHVAIIRPHEKEFDPRFIRYLLASPAYQGILLSIAAVGATRNAITKGMIENLDVIKPPIKQQVKIADKLEALDDKIELNTQINQTLEQIAQALFKSWFVDFDPVKAKIAVLEAGGTAEAAELAAMGTIAAKSPEQLADMQQSQPKAYQQLAQTAALFPAAMEDSKLGEIPEGWVVTKISDFGSIICGKTPSKARSDFFGRDIPFIKIPDMHTSMFVVNASEYLSKAGAESQPKKDIPKGSICISSIATVGKVIITIERSQTNQQINSIVPDKSFHTPYLYFYMVLLENHFHDLSSGGSATLNMNTSTFARVNVVKPPDDILLRFHTAVKNNLYLIEKYLLSNLTLEDTRDTLLPKLLSGAIDLAHINKSSPNSL